MKDKNDIIHKSVEMAELEFKEAPMDLYYMHPVAGIFSRLRIKHILRILSDIESKKILDAGCEAGYVSQKLVVAGANVISFDICLDALKSFKQKIEENCSKSLLFQAFAHAIPLKNESIDAVVCTEVIEHAPYPDIILKEIARVVRKGGKIIITFPNERLRKSVYAIVSLFGINTEIEQHVTMFQYGPQEIEFLCRKYFRVVSMYSIPFFFPLTRFIVCLKD